MPDNPEVNNQRSRHWRGEQSEAAKHANEYPWGLDKALGDDENPTNGHDASSPEDRHVSW